MCEDSAKHPQRGKGYPMTTNFRYNSDPVAKDRVDHLIYKMIQTVCGEDCEPNVTTLRVLRVAKEFLLKGESICAYMGKDMGAASFDPAMVTLVDNKPCLQMTEGSIKLDGTGPQGYYLMWHIALNPVNGRGVPFDLDTGDEDQAVQQFCAQAGVLLEQNPKQFTCMGHLNSTAATP